MDELPKPPGHVELVDALLELATSAGGILDDLTRANDVADRAAATDFLRDALYELLAPTSMLFGERDLRAATAVLEAAASITIGGWSFVPCEVEAEVPRRDPRNAHRRPRRPVIPRKRSTRDCRDVPETYTDAPLLGGLFGRALLLATEHHRRQLRKGTEVPYISHLLSVAALTLEMGGTETEAIAALLHDAVEDGGGPPMLARIDAEFGPDVARIVQANSDSDTEPKPPWGERKRAYVASIAHKQPDELRVSLADKLHNARSILLDFRTHGDGLWTRFKAGQGTHVRMYYRALYDAFDARREALGPSAIPTLEELGRTVDEIDRLAA
jgi:HD domain